MAKQQKLDPKVFFRLIRYAGTYKKMVFISILTTILLAFIGPFRVRIIGQVADEYIVRNPDRNLLWISVAIIIAMLIGEAILSFLSTYFSNKLAQTIIYDLRIQLYNKVIRFRTRFFDKNPLGNLVTRMVSDLEAITEVFSSGLMQIAGDLLMLFIIIFWMFMLNFKLAFFVLVPIPILLIGTRIFARAMRKSFQLESQQVGRLNTFVQERLTGMNLVQLFSRQEREAEKFEKINAGHREAHIKAIWANSIFFPFVEMLSSLSVAFLYVITVLYLADDSATMGTKFGEVTAFTLWVNQLYRPIRMLADKFNILQRGTVRAERIFSLLDTEEQQQESGLVKNCDFTKDIVFKNVSFAYNDEDWVLRDIDLTIQAGKTTAFVGATGAGKTSLVNLLGRFYDYQKGQVSLGDVDLKNIEIGYLRQNIAIVLQDVFLFSDTIYNNITLGDQSISQQQVEEAAKAVGAHDFIVNLPGGYNYNVGERGGVLSVGQRQLISFIRAYVYNPQILILDEATSSVDNTSEMLIQNATEALTKGRTSVVIAHRLSTIRNADQIVVLERGQIVEQGTHEELLRQEGFYKKLSDMQFAKKD